MRLVCFLTTAKMVPPGRELGIGVAKEASDISACTAGAQPHGTSRTTMPVQIAAVTPSACRVGWYIRWSQLAALLPAHISPERGMDSSHLQHTKSLTEYYSLPGTAMPDAPSASTTGTAALSRSPSAVLSSRPNKPSKCSRVIHLRAPLNPKPRNSLT